MDNTPKNDEIEEVPVSNETTNEQKKSEPSLTHKKVRRFNKGLKITLLTILCVVVLFVVLCFSTYIPRVKATDYDSDIVKANPHIAQKTLVSAHRAGRNLAPENTLAAFKACFENLNEYSVDILEFDLHLTADGYLILLHDDTLDRTSDCVEVYGESKVKPIDKTYEQLKQYNMGYNFEIDGEYPYRDSKADLSDCRICTLEDVLEYVATQEIKLGKHINYIIEIKDEGENGFKAADKLAEIMERYGITKRTIIGTFHGEVSKYLDENHPEIIRSAGIAEVLSFYFGYIFGVPLTNVKYKVLQIPYKDFVINFGKKGMIDYAHKYGIAVQYWTINKGKDIEHLSSIGADAIMSDDPKLAYQLIYGEQ